ncbi:peptidoglycan-binding protein [Streptomyces sp. NBC_00316]|uniref:peptidoglycan-binding protein n=1 Tax=Streptomyces sp. NBC_00316 TaxID=2975710 RepID=UPI002E2DD239|nr:peptidoglycan-binding protein [Streptomyces sp. NBC_00316]
MAHGHEVVPDNAESAVDPVAEVVAQAASDGGSGLARRRRLLSAVVVVAVVVSGLGIVSARVIKSPAQAAADTAAPPPSVMTAPVERRVLRESVIVRGTVSASQTVEISPSGSGEGGGSPVVTKMNLTAGSTFSSGRVLMEVSGRPVIALKGTLPVYRDLKPGAEGEDVAQLQQVLKEAGHSTSDDRSGYFGAGTKAALAAFYQGIGYDPLPAEADGDASVASAQDAVTAARRNVEDLQAAQRSAADPGRTAGSPAAPATGRVPGTGDGSSPTTQLQRAGEDLAKAQQQLAQVKARTGPMLPAAEVVYLKGFPARVDKVAAEVGSHVSGSVMTVSAGRLVVRGFLQDQQRRLVRPGQRVQIVSELEGKSAMATVRSVSDSVAQQQQTPGTEGPQAESSGAQGYAMVVVPDKGLDASMAGQDVRLTIETAATEDKVLVVPVTAVSAGADGSTAVTAAERNGTRHRIPVTTGAAGDGYVEIRPEAGFALAAGDQVITGVAATGTGSSAVSGRS